ncbi:hypothetical protein DSCO28_03070 [Desulfosarcina ovata subsp. sediminis]|uniref:Uncharacterized protein n=1 Tax=Desulfosarcina ovata subsp. sediminis TaxID=885957 RepID=A0A5K7ZFN3_9BACT|nr:hypothetical protein [Desulfosarcina ovata]BBO79741.1 hypothetical protein DSCO28_03070 [Desulfosarcina ovata subsp. sediminis]
MKECLKCKKMNSAYADSCKYCGYDIKWAPDDGTDYKSPPNFTDEDTKFQNSGTIDEEGVMNPDRTSLDDIYNQLEGIKEQMSKGVNLFDVTMPFGKMVLLIIKLTFASIPALIIVGFVILIFWIIFGRLFFGLIMRGYGIN